MERELDQCVALYNASEFTSHTLGSNSTATLGPSVMVLSALAGPSLTYIVSTITLAAFVWYLVRKGKLVVCFL